MKVYDFILPSIKYFCKNMKATSNNAALKVINILCVGYVPDNFSYVDWNHLWSHCGYVHVKIKICVGISISNYVDWLQCISLILM